MADKIEKCEEAAAIVREYEKITCTKKRIICLAYHLGEVFWKFKEKKMLVNMVKEFKVNKLTMTSNYSTMTITRN